MADRRFKVKLQTDVSPEIPYLIRSAAKQAGFETSADWHRDRLCRLLAAELGEDFDDLMADMPLRWRDNPGAVKLSAQSDSKSGV
jgi:hypothetical protein